MITTHHGEIRLRGSLGKPKWAVPRMVAKALMEGQPHRELHSELWKCLDNV